MEQGEVEEKKSSRQEYQKCVQTKPNPWMEFRKKKQTKQNKTKNHNNNIKNKVEHVHNMKNL